MPLRYLLSLFVLTFSVSTLWSPVLSQAQSQLPYWTKAAPPTVARQELYPDVTHRNNVISFEGSTLKLFTR
jgi:hypothetical protein